MPTVLFVNRLPTPPADGLFVDFRDYPGTRPEDSAGAPLREAALSTIYRRHGEEWQRAFINWLGALNIVNARLEWWAYTSTAKNLLSSPLGNKLFQVLAVLKLIEETAFDRLYLVGTSPAQYSIIRQWLAEHCPKTHVDGCAPATELGAAEVAARLVHQASRTALAITWWRTRFVRSDADIFALTYVNGGVTDGNDTFFGGLPSLLAARHAGLRFTFLAYMLAPYPVVLPRLREFRKHAYWPLFFELTAADFLWGLRKAWRALNAEDFQLTTAIQGLDARPLLLEAFRWDVAKGGYLFNMLAYRAALRFARGVAPARVLFPFENKALEKTFVLGLRQGAPGARIVGYQHTSVTRRHTTMLLAKGEARVTPLPDIIVTAGEVTRRFLEDNGNYPPGIFATGCALRQNRSAAAAPAGPDKRPRILLVLSSSRFELTRTIEFFRSVTALEGEFELGVRPHPEFPLSLLPAVSRAWITVRARDFSGSNLADNIDWCTVVAYVSSTVALEAMMCGKPAINIDLGEMVIPDPVLGAPPLWRRVASPAEFSRTLDDLSASSSEERESDRERTKAYLQSYFRLPEPGALEAFLR